MKYCSNCGEPLNDEAKFCTKCGTKVSDVILEPKNKVIYDGRIHKCPNCGEIINSFVSECPSCGYEFRDTEANDSIMMLEKRINDIESSRSPSKKNKGIFNAIANDKPSDTDLKVINTIKSFPIPNNKEDIMEFMILASSNIDLDAYDSASGGLKNARQEVSNAWVSKMEQAYQKACIICKDDPEFKKIEEFNVFN